MINVSGYIFHKETSPPAFFVDPKNRQNTSLRESLSTEDPAGCTPHWESGWSPCRPAICRCRRWIPPVFEGWPRCSWHRNSWRRRPRWHIRFLSRTSGWVRCYSQIGARGVMQTEWNSRSWLWHMLASLMLSYHVHEIRFAANHVNLTLKLLYTLW